jgi:hypothetical protein
MRVDFMAVAAMAVAVTDSSEEATTLNLLSAICYLLFAICYSEYLSCGLSWLAQWNLRWQDRT